jgi:phage-related protein
VRRRSLIVGALLILGAVAGLTVVRHGGIKRRRLRVLPLVLVILGGFDWDPLSWLSDIGHFAVKTFDDVKNFVYTVVGHAIKGAYDAIKAAADGVADAFEFVDHSLTNFYNWSLGELARIGDAFWHLLDGWWQSVEPIIHGWADDVRNWAASAINFVVGVLQGLINDVKSFALGLYNDFILPLWHFFLTAVDFVGHVFDDLWSVIWNNVIKPEFDILHDLYEKMLAIWDWWINELPTVWKVIKGAWHWLLWFADHSFGLLEALWSGDTQKINRQFIQGFAKVDHEVLSLIDESIGQVFS